MAQSRLTAKTAESAKPRERPYEIRDQRIGGLILRVQPSGVKSWVCQYARGKRTTLGKFPTRTLEWARDRAKLVIANKGPLPEDREIPTLREFVKDRYKPYALEHNTTGYHLAQRIERAFKDYLDKPLDQITPWIIDKWRVNRLKERKPGTVNRDVGALKSALSKAVDWGVLDEHPLKSVKPKREDKRGITRYLSDEEKRRLRTALDAREARLRDKRKSGNAWRRERGISELPDLQKTTFADHLKPMVLVSLNTGVRQGELYKLRWEDVDFQSCTLRVRGGGSKNAQTRSIPLNQEAHDTLKAWKSDFDSEEYVFAGRKGRPFNNTKRSWAAVLEAADIKGFRWHDLRHTFASYLVMGGVDLYTVSQLLGHSSTEITKRYAHLAPDHLKAAVSVLDV